MAFLLKTAPVRVSFIQIMQVRVQNKGKSVWKSRYVGDVSVSMLMNLKLKQLKLGPNPLICNKCIAFLALRVSIVAL